LSAKYGDIVKKNLYLSVGLTYTRKGRFCDKLCYSLQPDNSYRQRILIHNLCVATNFVYSNK